MKTDLNREIAGITKALADRGVDVKQSDIIESVAVARGFRNAHEMMADTKASADRTEQTTGNPPADQADDRDPDEADLRFQLMCRNAEIEQLREDLRCTRLFSHFDWQSWGKVIRTLKVSAHHKKQPITDENLDMIRAAVANNATKNNAADRDSARYKVQALAEKLMAPLLVRLDQAEELLGKGEKFDLPALNAIRNLTEVSANRDGDTHDQCFIPNPYTGLDEDAQGVILAAKAFRLHMEDMPDYEDADEIDGFIDELRAEMDGCDVGPASVNVSVKDAIDALAKGEGSILLYRVLMSMAATAGIDPHDNAKVIYPKDPG